MAYFNGLPLVEYPSRFKDQSSNQDYVQIRNIFRRAKLREDVASYLTAFDYYQIKDNERPDQISEKVYGTPDLDWVILITNNIINYPSNWVLNNDNLYEYLIDKYGSEDKLNEVKYLETNEVLDEYNRLVVPEKLKVDDDIYEDFTTIVKDDNELFYDLKRYPVPNELYPLKITSNLGQYVQVWERDNLGGNEEYKGTEYQITDIRLKEKVGDENFKIGDNSVPEYSRIDYSYLDVYGRDEEVKEIFNPITLNGWPYTWGAFIQIYNRDSTITRTPISSNVGVPVEITDDFRLYAISSLYGVDNFSNTSGTILENEANKTYVVSDLSSNQNGVKSKFKVYRNSLGEVIQITLEDGGRKYIPTEQITINGNLIGGEDITDDIIITVDTTKPRPQFRFISIGNKDNQLIFDIDDIVRQNYPEIENAINSPFPGVKITIFNETGISYLNTFSTKVDIFDNINKVTNYEYELELNENNRRILILKPEYVGTFIADFNNIMRYDETSESVSNILKRTYNPKLAGQ